MIIMLFLALVLFTVYFIHTFHYSRHWMENFEVTLAFSEEQAGEGDTLFLYETAVNKKKMGLPIMCVKFLASRFLQFEGAESGTVSDHFYRNDVMSVGGFEKVRRKLKFTCKVMICSAVIRLSRKFRWKFRFWYTRPVWIFEN